jgi:hypothetical protein
MRRIILNLNDKTYKNERKLTMNIRAMRNKKFNDLNISRLASEMKRSFEI